MLVCAVMYSDSRFCLSRSEEDDEESTTNLSKSFIGSHFHGFITFSAYILLAGYSDYWQFKVNQMTHLKLTII